MNIAAACQGPVLSQHLDMHHQATATLEIAVFKRLAGSPVHRCREVGPGSPPGIELAAPLPENHVGAVLIDRVQVVMFACEQLTSRGEVNGWPYFFYYLRSTRPGPPVIVIDTYHGHLSI